MRFANSVKQRLQQYRSDHLYRQRQLRATNSKAQIFCSNDYLGLSQHPDVIAAAQKGAAKYGVGSGASALICGYQPPHAELEAAFADFVGHERALLFPTGYMANVGVLSALSKQQDHIFQDKLCHASLIDAVQLSGAKLWRYAHLDMQHLTKRLQAAPVTGQRFLVSDGVFSMDGDIAPLPELVQLAKQQAACVMLDDAHGIGVLGKQGRGTIDACDVNPDDIDILVCPLGKAFGISGALVSGSEDFIESLVQFARSYIYTTAMPPMLACAALASLTIIKTESWRREKLAELIQGFKKTAAACQLPVLPSITPIQSIVIGEAKKALAVSAALLKKGFVVTAIRPPTVAKGTARLRITLNCQHQLAEIDALLHCLSDILVAEGCAA